MLNERFEKFSEMENVEMLETILIPKLVEFTGLINEMELNHVRMCEVVRKLDDDLSTKANKVLVNLLREDIAANFTSNDV